MANDVISSKITSVCLSLFDGQHKNYQIWWTRFIAYASVHEFTPALKIGGEMNAMPSRDDTVVDTNTHAAMAKAKRRNAIAMANLTMAFTSESTMGLIDKAQTEEGPGAHLDRADLDENRVRDPYPIVQRIFYWLS
jgi:hypothetical protein